MSYQDLPGEILALISDAVGVEDLDSFVLINRATFQHSTKRLRIHRQYQLEYTSVQVGDTNLKPHRRRTSHFPLALELLRKVAGDKTSLEYVRDLDIGAVPGTEEDYFAALADIDAWSEELYGLVVELGMNADTTESYEDLGRSVHMSLRRQARHYIFEKPVRPLLCRIFPNLRSVGVSGVADIWDDGAHIQFESGMEPWFKLSSLSLTIDERLEPHSLFDVFEELPDLQRLRFLIECKKETHWKPMTNRQPILTSLKTLEILFDGVVPPLVSLILHNAPSLTTLHTASAEGLASDSLWRLLNTAPRSLGKLSVLAHMDGSIRSSPDKAADGANLLKQLPRLVELEIDTIWLVAQNGIRTRKGIFHSEESPSLLDILPRTLRYLGLRMDRHGLMKGLERSTSLCLIKLFHGFGDSVHDNLPDLKEVRLLHASSLFLQSVHAELGRRRYLSLLRQRPLKAESMWTDHLLDVYVFSLQAASK